MLIQGNTRTFSLKGAKIVPITDVDDKRQITATLAASGTGDFLPIPLLYSGKTKRSIQQFSFPLSFSVPLTKIIGLTQRNLWKFLKR